MNPVDVDDSPVPPRSAHLRAHDVERHVPPSSKRTRLSSCAHTQAHTTRKGSAT